jgi:hypothetical protein
MSQQKGNQQALRKFYLNISFIGALRGGLCLLIEHPLESIKTQWQDNTQIKTTRNIIKNIYSQKGLIGFYRGFFANFIRVISKNFYRWPMMIFFPRLYDKNLPPGVKKKYPGLSKILTGLSIANLEILILCPLDRIKIFLMTSKFTASNSSKSFYFYHEYKTNLLRELFRGIEPTFWRSNVSWISFLYLDHKIKNIWRELKKTQVLDFRDLFFISIFVGAGNLAASKLFFTK